MKNKKTLLLVFFFLSACNIPQSVIEDYTQCYTNKYNGIDTLCRINGFYFYKSQEFNSAELSIMLYEDGTFVKRMHSYSNIDNLVKDLNNGGSLYYNTQPDNVFKDKKLYNISGAISWGTYQIKNDTILAQAFNYRVSSPSVVVETHYKIIDSLSIQYLGSKVLGYSFEMIRPKETVILKFIPLENKPPSKPWLKKKKVVLV